MSPTPPNWPKLLSLAVHELRTPMTVVAGYVRMLLRERAGPISDQQRKLLEETERSCARLNALVAEVGEVAKLEAGTATFDRQEVALLDLLHQVADELRAARDPGVKIDLRASPNDVLVAGDPVRLRQAFSALLSGVLREAVLSRHVIFEYAQRFDQGQASATVLIADEASGGTLAAVGSAELDLFDEWRGGMGLTLAIARRVIEAHHGHVWSVRVGDGKAAVMVVLPGKPATGDL